MKLKECKNMNEIKRMQKLAGLNELGINIPGQATLEQLKRWHAEIQTSNDKMTKIKLALKCAENIMWICREKHPTDNRPQTAINAVKEYIKDPSAENAQKCEDAAKAVWAAVNANDNAVANAYQAVANAAYTTVDYPAAPHTNAVYAAIYAIQAITNHKKERQLNELKHYQNMNEIKRMQQLAGINELGINTPPGRATLEQLKRWKAEIKASDDIMTKIKLALKCAEGVMWIWREKHPTNNYPQAAINAVKVYINNPSDENAQKCRKAADAAWDNAWTDTNRAVTAAVYAADAVAAAAYAVVNPAYYGNDIYEEASSARAAANNAIKALTKYQEKRKLNEIQHVIYKIEALIKVTNDINKTFVYNSIRGINGVVVVSVEQNNYLDSQKTDEYSYSLLKIKYMVTTKPEDDINIIKKKALISDKIEGLIQFLPRFQTIQKIGEY